MNRSANQVANTVNAQRRIFALASATTRKPRTVDARQSVPLVKTVYASNRACANVWKVSSGNSKVSACHFAKMDARTASASHRTSVDATLVSERTQMAPALNRAHAFAKVMQRAWKISVNALTDGQDGTVANPLCAF